MENTCRNCKFVLDDQNIAPVCRRYPAAVYKGMGDWCGEFAPVVRVYRVAEEPKGPRKYDGRSGRRKRR